MKLNQVLEQAYATKGAHPEFSTQQTADAKQWLLNGGVKHSIESDKFFIVEKYNSYGIFRQRDQELIGWILLQPVQTIHGLTVHPLVNIQILPKYRNTAAILILITALRVLLKHPVYIDDPIFTGGERLLDALAKRADMPNVKVLDKNTGNIRDYKQGELTVGSTDAILIEKFNISYEHTDSFPGGSRVITLALCESYHCQFDV